MDARGFRVQELLQDTDEADYQSLDAARPLSYLEIKSDIALRNGARFYNDHAHPEYCTPECSTLLEIIQQDYAGDALLMACVRNLNQNSDNPVLLYKNNTDFRGHSYGCHENYLMPRKLPWDLLSSSMVAFFVTRQIVCGAGKFGWEEEDKFVGPGFQVSQRSDFFSELQSVDTMQRRPIINTRDEPHADREKYRRLHVIVGDSNMSEYTIWLRQGVTAIVLAMIEDGAIAKDLTLRDPVRAIKEVSHDVTLRRTVELAAGKKLTAIGLQREYHELARKYQATHELPSWAGEILDHWLATLDALERDPSELADRIDWVAKQAMIDAFLARKGLDWESPQAQMLDLQFHDVRPEKGLAYLLERQGKLRRLVSDEEIVRAITEPPEDTRAYFRGQCLKRYGEAVFGVNWDSISFGIGDEPIKRVMMAEPLKGSKAHVQELLDRSPTAADLVRNLRT